jgi:hypothetical protein
MPTSCNTHDYDGELREKWLSMRSLLIKEYFHECLCFEDTLKDIEEWLNEKYCDRERITDAKRSLNILSSQRRSNFDSINDINVEELLPILWNKVKNQNDLHDTFYEQLCDITDGSCSQGRSTRFFQFLFLFDRISTTEPDLSTMSNPETKLDTSDLSLTEEQQQLEKD